VKNKKDDKVLKISESEEKKIKRASQLCIKKTMEEIIKELQEKHSIHEKKLTDMLSKLEKLSASGIKPQKYLDLLNETIKILDEANKLSFSPDYALRNFLVGQETSIKELASKKSAKKQAKAQQILQETREPLELEEEEEEKEVEPAILDAASKPKTRAELEMLFEQPLQAAESPVAYVKEKKNIINQLWILCSKQDLHFGLEIIKKETHLNSIRKSYLEAACRANDIPIVSALFNEEKDVYITARLRRIAIDHGHYDMLHFLYGKKTIKYLVDCSWIPWDESRNKTFNDLTKSSPSSLWFAYKEKDFALFSTILEAEEGDPDETNNRQEPLLYICIEENQLDFARKLLDSGADINKAILQTYLDTFCLDKVLSRKPLNTNVGWTPLHRAIADRNQEAFALLVDEYKADITQRTSDGWTAFGAAVCCEKPLCKEIIEKMIRMGCDINEKLGKYELTGLYYACQFKDKQAVQLLLALGADPLQTQIMDTSEGKRAGNPLLIALFKADSDIVDMILTQLEQTKSPLNHKEILRILFYEHLLNESSKTRLESLYRQAYYKNVILCAYQEGRYEEAIEAFCIFFTQRPSMPADEAHFILYTISCCLLESGKNKEKEGDLQTAKERIEEGIGQMQTCLSIRQSQQAFQSHLYQGLVAQAQEKIAELQEKQAALDAQLAMANNAQEHRAS
jgi:ankyrin repeat protein